MKTDSSKIINCDMCLHTSENRKIIDYNGKKLRTECINSLKFPRDFEKMKKEVKEILKSSSQKSNKKYDCIMALSGGKDSVVALYLIKEELKLKPLCVTVDNNYLAREALENCYNITRYLNVDWVVLNRDYTKLFKMTIGKGESPCRSCSEFNMREIWKFAKDMNIDKIVTGHELPFGTTAIRNMKSGIMMIRLLAAYRLTEEDRYKILKKLPWTKPNLGGYTTNCLVLGPALKKFHEKHGFSFEFDRISAMVRYGLMDREKAIDALKCPEVPEEVYDELKKRGLDLKSNE
ncbi:MAG: hypothetical protein PWP15_677 [Methanothermococcus sp.]|uniref:hypothetical protein n=1 Tax=Methanothermococcus sp. TaxID=2614238 RepID=UPI00258DFF2A|nr:hypothetical protein [Methanothermococcus sp.]MDK2790170.1 hypothetical protein [Methanothermococcus sp.]